MAKISDDHFHKLEGAGPKRLRPAPEPERRSASGLIVVGLVIIAAGVGGWVLKRGQVETLPAVVEATPAAMPVPVAVSRVHVPYVLSGAPASVVHASPIVDQQATERQRRQLNEQIQSLGRGVVSMNKEAVDQRRSIAVLHAQIVDCDTRHWPKPNGPNNYEGYLASLRDAARAKGDLHGANTIEVEWTRYRDNRNKTLLELERQRGVLASLEQRIATAKAESEKAKVDLVALPSSTD